MPSRNSIKQFADNAYYHIYNRGNNKQTVFHDDQDYKVFLNLLKRHLSLKPSYDRQGRKYPHLKDSAGLLTYCLMPNHFHLLVLNRSTRGIESLMRSVSTSYVGYYNKKYQRIGSLFQGRYKAALITNDAYLQHISRYIHLNPKGYQDYPYSSYKALTQNWCVEWLDAVSFWDTFDGNIHDYKEFVADFEDYKKSLETIEQELADS